MMGIRAGGTIRRWIIFIYRKAYYEAKRAFCMAKNQRADAKNPNNPSEKSAGDNRANQINPNNSATKSGKRKK
ncbi:hypothetical protein J2T58_002106 [Methanocalculus alkaliphilus]|nr:hypothetical protein [Methanocalculus alkaliphilus]